MEEEKYDKCNDGLRQNNYDLQSALLLGEKDKNKAQTTRHTLAKVHFDDWEEDILNRTFSSPSSNSNYMFKRREVKESKKELEERLLSEKLAEIDAHIVEGFDKLSSALVLLANSISSMHTSPNFPQNRMYNEECSEFEDRSEHSWVLGKNDQCTKDIRSLYPFEEFEEKGLARLDREEKEVYDEILDFSDNNKALAFYLFSHKDLSISTKKDILSLYKEYTRVADKFDIGSLKTYFIKEDMSNSQTKSTLERKWKQWRSIWCTSFGIDREKFPLLKFRSSKKGNKSKEEPFTQETVRGIIQMLYSHSKFEYGLMIHLMYECSLFPGEINYITYESSGRVDGKYFVKVFRSKSRSFSTVYISLALYEELKEYGRYWDSVGICPKEERIFPGGVSIKGHFIFKIERTSLAKKFSDGFDGVISDFKIKPKDLRMSSIYNSTLNCSDNNRTYLFEKPHSLMKADLIAKKLENTKKV